MGTVSISALSGLNSISIPRDYNPFVIFNTAGVLTACSTRSGSFRFHGAQRHSKLRTFSVGSLSPTASFRTQVGTWEAPDDGSGSEDEEDEEEEEEELGFQSEWEEEEGKGVPDAAAAAVDKSTTNKYEEDLVQEVEQLLGQEEIAILQKRAAPNIKKISTDGTTALHTAIIAKKEAVISHLLRKGASPHVRDKDGATPLHYAVHVGTKRIVKLLIKYKVDVNIADNIFKDQFSGFLPRCNVIPLYGISFPGKHLISVIRVAEVEQLLGQEEIAILQKRAAPNIKKISTDGTTALHTAIIAKKEAVISHLLRKGASPHVRDKDGATPLHYAVHVGTKRIVKLLIKYKVDVNIADNDGRTPLDLGLCYGKDFKSYDLTKLLKTVPMDREF
ncbi:hypothetical protein C1H46_018839 [Malus baccata]|uniref:Uncharacterized protein n=1 Tax=Malus baccata TaxID=106549 RepID=A0A540MA10_MALBA|nr:hypothetical protein C1H46_018839 [Malus baccata]